MKQPSPPQYLIVEGPSYSGNTRQAELLAEKLALLGRDVQVATCSTDTDPICGRLATARLLAREIQLGERQQCGAALKMARMLGAATGELVTGWLGEGSDVVADTSWLAIAANVLSGNRQALESDIPILAAEYDAATSAPLLPNGIVIVDAPYGLVLQNAIEEGTYAEQMLGTSRQYDMIRRAYHLLAQAFAIPFVSGTLPEHLLQQQVMNHLLGTFAIGRPRLTTEPFRVRESV
ncbi:MAG TPA: hypothetical protein VGS28_00610 [Candidatus Saccharimonadales bacterium]|nr:hypothetical protein [Candidatus Saccharimonadales bacterium]